MGLLQEDEAASAALRKLFEQVSKDIEARREHRSVMSSGTSWSFDIPPGVTTFFTPPYDYARPGPTHGHDVNVAADPVAGAFSVEAVPTGDWDGAVAGASAIGIDLEFRNTGLVSVRPLIKYDCDWLVDTYALSASSVRHIGFQANAEGGPIVSTIQDFTAWNFTDDNIGEDGGYVRSPYREVKFSAEAHRRYELWIWTTVSGDQSGGYAWGYNQMWGPDMVSWRSSHFRRCKKSGLGRVQPAT